MLLLAGWECELHEFYLQVYSLVIQVCETSAFEILHSQALLHIELCCHYSIPECVPHNMLSQVHIQHYTRVVVNNNLSALFALC